MKFLYKLARLQHRSIGEVRRTNTAAELHGWAEEWRTDPWSEERADLRAASIATTVANGLGGKKGGGTFRLSEMQLKFGAVEQQTGEPRGWEDQKIDTLGRAIAAGNEDARQKLIAEYGAEMQEEDRRIAAWMTEQQARFKAEQAAKTKAKG